MTDSDAYLQKLQKSLSSLPPEKQDEILAEIESHIEEEAENGRFPSTTPDISQRMGSPEEMGRGITAVYTNRKHLILLLLVPFLVFEAFPTIYNAIGMILVEPSADRFPTIFPILYSVLAFGGWGVAFFAWRRIRLIEVALWWTSAILTLRLVPIITSPIWAISGILQQPTWWDWLINIVFFGLLLWLIWSTRQDALLVIFGTLPLTLGLVIQGFQSYQTYRIGLNDPMMDLYMEPMIRILMWLGVIICYFLFKTRWLRWLGIGSTIYFYLFGITYLMLNLPRTGQINFTLNPATKIWEGHAVAGYGPDILWPLLIFVWVWPFAVLIGGLLLERGMGIQLRKQTFV